MNANFVRKTFLWLFTEPLNIHQLEKLLLSPVSLENFPLGHAVLIHTNYLLPALGLPYHWGWDLAGGEVIPHHGPQRPLSASAPHASILLSAHTGHPIPWLFSLSCLQNPFCPPVGPQSPLKGSVGLAHQFIYPLHGVVLLLGMVSAQSGAAGAGPRLLLWSSHP